jgi:hypothetical protein
MRPFSRAARPCLTAFRSIVSSVILESCRIEDERRLDSRREGMVEGLCLGSYLLLVDYTGRVFREGKAATSREAAEIFERLLTSRNLADEAP